MSEEVTPSVEVTPEVTPESVSDSVETPVETTVDSSEQLQEVIEEAAESGASKEEIADMIREFDLKVNGKTIRKTLDLSNEDAVRAELQKAYAGQQAMQEAAELKKLFGQEIQRLKDDPYRVLEELGLNPDELAESRINQRIEQMKKSPEQQERERIQLELEEARKEAAESKRLADEMKQARLQEQAAVKLDDEINTALSAHSDLPNSPGTVRRIADVMLWAMDQGMDDVTVEDVLPTVKKEIQNELNSFMNELPVEFIEKYIGKRGIDRLREQRIKAVKDVESAAKVKPVSKKLVEEERKKTRIEDWMKS